MQQSKIRISWVLVYIMTPWIYLHMFPTTIVLTKDKIKEKWLGFIKIKEIPLKEIHKVQHVKKKLVKKGLSRIWFLNAFKIKLYINKNRDYI